MQKTPRHHYFRRSLQTRQEVRVSETPAWPSYLIRRCRFRLGRCNRRRHRSLSDVFSCWYEKTHLYDWHDNAFGEKMTSAVHSRLTKMGCALALGNLIIAQPWRRSP